MDETDPVGESAAPLGDGGGTGADDLCDGGNGLEWQQAEHLASHEQSVVVVVVPENHTEQIHTCSNTSRDRLLDGDGDGEVGHTKYPEWLQLSFEPNARDQVAALHKCGERIQRHGGQDETAMELKDACEECNKRTAVFQCNDCTQRLCFTCVDAIHIIPSLTSHAIELLEPSRARAESTTTTRSPARSPSPSPSPRPSPRSVATLAFAPATQIEHRLHLPIGTKLFFRSADHCNRWPRELLHGTLVGLNHGVRSSEASDSFHYRVLWLRGVEALANGFFRATLLLPAPSWPVEIGLFPSQLAAFRAVLTAERLARVTLRRERVSGRWHNNYQTSTNRPKAKPDDRVFPGVAIVNEILDETEAVLGHEFRTRLTQTDDVAFLESVARGTWQFAQWIASIGRGHELGEDAAAILELDEELRTMEASATESPLSPLAELLLLWSPRGRMRFFLVPQHELLLLEPLQRRHVETIIQQMLFVYVGFAWQRWRHFITRHRRHEHKLKRAAAATRLQLWWQRTRVRIDEAKRRIATATAAASTASPIDALDLYRRRQLCAGKLYRLAARQYADRQRHALHHWAAATSKAVAPQRLELVPVPVPGAWHKSHGIASLPRLPRMYAHLKPDGSVAIDDLPLYKQFRANHAGPTESSYWVLRHRVLAGAYPAGVPAFRDARRIVARADYAMSVVLQEIGTFVCLAEPQELLAHEKTVDAACLVQQQQQQHQQQKWSCSSTPATEPNTASISTGGDPSSSPRAAAPTNQTPWLFERIVRCKYDTLRAELMSAVKTSERHAQLAQRELNDFVSSSSSCSNIVMTTTPETSSASSDLLLETLTNKLTLAQQSVRKAHETLAQLQPLDFVLFPIPKDNVPLDLEALESFLQALEDRLRRQQRVFVFSMQGHGRTGFVAALLLGRLYGLTAREALERAQRVHDCQVAMSSSRAVSSPHAASQITLVTQLLAHTNDAIYAPVVSENSAAAFVSWRSQQRGQPIDAFATRAGFMVSERVDEATQLRQQQEHEARRRIGKRESHAMKLQIARRRVVEDEKEEKEEKLEDKEREKRVEEEIQI